MSLYGCMGGEWAILQNTDRWEKPVRAENGPFFWILTDGRSPCGCRMDHPEYWQEEPVWAENGPFFGILTDGRSLYGCRMDHSSQYWQMGEASIVVCVENGPLWRILTDMRGTCWRFSGQQRMACPIMTCAWWLLAVQQNMPKENVHSFCLVHTGSCLRNSQTLSKDHFLRRRNCSITHTVWTQVSSWINFAFSFRSVQL